MHHQHRLSNEKTKLRTVWDLFLHLNMFVNKTTKAATCAECGEVLCLPEELEWGELRKPAALLFIPCYFLLFLPVPFVARSDLFSGVNIWAALLTVLYLGIVFGLAPWLLSRLTLCFYYSSVQWVPVEALSYEDSYFVISRQRYERVAHQVLFFALYGSGLGAGIAACLFAILS